jgi:hypothetical protein
VRTVLYPDPKGRLDLKVTRAILVQPQLYPDHRGQSARKVYRVFKAMLALLALKVIRVTKVIKAIQVHRAYPDLRAD